MGVGDGDWFRGGVRVAVLIAAAEMGARRRWRRIENGEEFALLGGCAAL